ncbi:MAG: hypothetical protein COW40_16275 [Cytophagales bacterium CG17_big_fil_post_rev_8_21_14_2_50_40_13]|nr:MAG: hypothetical protein COW40_16275 [Cytophagales bacterium CG17_big_fil_post_rev_8_21_14_2_50_40_13]
MKKSTNICVLLLLLAVFSCSDGNLAGKEAMVDIDEFKVFELKRQAPKVRLVDLIEEVEIMRLEETDQSRLAFVTDLQQEGEMLVFRGSKEETIYFFF